MIATEETQVVIAMPVTEAFEKSQSALVARAESFVVHDADSYRAGFEILGQLKTADRAVDDFALPAVRASNEAHKEAKKIENKLRKPISEARFAMNGKVGRWKLEQDARDRAERDRLAAIEKKKEDDRRQAEVDRLAEQAANAPTEEAAVELLEQADDVIDQEQPPVNVMVPRSVPKVQGGSIRTTPDFRVVNAASIRPEYTKPDEVKIRLQVKALGKKAEGVVGGIVVFDKPIVTTK